jgi:pSer/pThr/pTyr-binding forkhead associated (FHA) protein
MYTTYKENFLLGRSDECEIVIKDPHISRVQARVRIENSKYFVENLGKNPIFVNGLPTHGQFLKNGDELKIGMTDLTFQQEEAAFQVNQIPQFEDKTVAITSPIDRPLGPKLVLINTHGENKIYPLDFDRIIVGRSADAHVQLEDPAVSRRNCLIERRENKFYVRNLSETNPLLINDQKISEKQLYSGDQIRIGPFSLAFISDRPEDASPIEETIITQKKGPGWVLWLGAACLLLVLGVYVFYWHVYSPWDTGQNIEKIESQITAGDFPTAQEKLKNLLTKDITPEQFRKVSKMLSSTALAITSTIARDGKIQDAQKYLIEHLSEYGAGDEAQALWDRLDYYRITLGQQLESNQEYQAALSQYAAIREDGPYFEEAQKSIKRIWLAYQQQQRQNQTLSQLIGEAEAHFRAKRYLTPMNQNAYSAYQAVLALEPEHNLALERIEQIKSYYRDLGEKYFEQKVWLKALTYFERFTLIDPASSDINEKISICKQKLATAKPRTKKVKPRKVTPKEKPDEQREKIKRMLEESGTDSSWVMKYLFEEKTGETDSEKPW